MPHSDSVLIQHIEHRNRHYAASQPAANAEHYLAVLQDRADRYAAHMATMTISPIMVQWALSMTAKHQSEYVKVHHFIADWLTALMILRYGEEPDPNRSTDETFAGWPVRFSERDMARANALLAGIDWPKNVFTLLTPPATETESPTDATES